MWKRFRCFLYTKLKVCRNISIIIHKANSITGVVKRSFECLDFSMLQLLYTVLVWLCVSYLESLPIGLLEQVQRQVTQQVFQLKDLPHSERLRNLNLPSLLHRRCRMDMIMVYKITQCLSGCPFENFFHYH